MTIRSFLSPWALSLVAAATLTACGGDGDSTPAAEAKPAIADGTRVVVALLETSDLHNNVRSYDYFNLKEDPSYGFERTSTLIKTARQEFPNNVLFDNGDTIQGTALADYEATVNPITNGDCTQKTQSMFKVLSASKVDAGTLGNHEFNYGLDYLHQVLGGILDVAGIMVGKKCAAPGYPTVLANVTSTKTGKPLVQPYTILSREFTGTTPEGKSVKVPVKVGVMGLTTPGILAWDKRWVEGKISIAGARETAEKYVPEIRSKGADLVVTLLHGGLDSREYDPTMENPGMHVSKVPGIDAIFLGHSHALFPDRGAKPAYTMAGVDNTAGTINGVPATMPLSWGQALGMIKMELVWDAKTRSWVVDKAKTRVEARETAQRDAAGKVTGYVAVDPAVAPLVEEQHQATIQYVKTPIGTTDFRMSTYFAEVGDVSAIQLVNQAQADYVKRYIDTNMPQYKNLPVLSISAPFMTGYQGPTNYTDVKPGDLAIFNAAALYLYPNTVYAVKVTGAEIKQWLEGSAKRFNQIDPAKTTDQQLLSSFPGYNFDMFTSPDVRYEIDVTKPEGQRIVNLQYKGQPIDAAASFIVATNNYRAASSSKSFNLPALDGRSTIYASPDANRDVVIEYIKTNKTITRAANGSERSWRFAKVNTAGKVVFASGANLLPVAQAAGISNLSLVTADNGKGGSVYAIDLSK